MLAKNLLGHEWTRINTNKLLVCVRGLINLVEENGFPDLCYRAIRVEPRKRHIFSTLLLGDHPAVVLQHGLADRDPAFDWMIRFEGVPVGEAHAGIVSRVEAGHVEVIDPA